MRGVDLHSQYSASPKPWNNGPGLLFIEGAHYCMEEKQNCFLKIPRVETVGSMCNVSSKKVFSANFIFLFYK